MLVIFRLRYLSYQNLTLVSYFQRRYL